MRRPDSGIIRFVTWIASAVAVTYLLYYGQAVTFFLLLNGSLNDTFGTSFPAIPFASILLVLFLVRWNEFHALLVKEGRFEERLPIRVLGAGLALLPALFARYSGSSLEVSAASIILVFYGSSLVVNPTTARMLLPYAGIYLTGVVAPAMIQYLVGEPFAAFTSVLSSVMVGIAGIPVSWNGTEFNVISKGGQVVAGTITPGCSSILSMTTFIGLLGLMHFDFKKDVMSTVKVAVVGVASLVVLNSMRIGILLWAAYDGGPEAIWGLHNWVGYAIFLIFYLGVLVVYSRIGGTTTAGPRLPGKGIPSQDGAIEL